MNLGIALRDVRRRKNKTQAQVSKKAKISQTYLSQIENGIKVPSDGVVKKLCKFYRVPLVAVVWMATEEADVAREKRQFFNQLGPTITSLVNEILK